VEIGGHQLIVEEGRWYTVNRLEVRFSFGCSGQLLWVLCSGVWLLVRAGY
jgi:hypothetical protein